MRSTEGRPINPPPAATITRQVATTLWHAVWQDRWRTAVALGFLVLAKLATVAVPLLLKLVIDQVSAAAPAAPSAARADTMPMLVGVPLALLLGYALLRFAGTLFTELRDLVFARVTQRTVAGFAERSFVHLMNLGPRFHTPRSTGTLIRQVEMGVAGIGFLLGAVLFTMLPTLVEFAAVLAVLASGYSGWFTAVILATFLAYGSLTLVLTRSRALHQRRVNEMDSRANGRLVDSLLNYESVKTFAREGHERRRYAEALASWSAGALRNQRSLSVLHIGQSLVIATGVAAMMVLAVQQTLRGEMSVGDLVLVNAYVLQVCLPLNALGFVYRESRDALVNTEALFAMLAEPGEQAPGPELPPLLASGGEVRFEQVSFAYEPGRKILDRVDLNIPAGQTVAVVGGSGSGKSTLARLLLRLYDVDSGRITVDGQDIRTVALPGLRQAIGVVPQDTVLFNDTIAANIGYGRLGAGIQAVVAAAKAAQVHDFILGLPQQYATMVGERGLALSGGEKQRIAIARAFLMNPQILVFDEATSALDSRTERAIQTELQRVARGRSTLVIAHRLSTVVDADQIVVMDKGRVVERGTHASLLARDGLYAQLWRFQRQQQDLEQLERRLARRPVNLVRLVASVIEGLHASFEPQGVHLQTDIDLGDSRVVVDPSDLAHALWDLSAAALEAAPPGQPVHLNLVRHGLHARLALTVPVAAIDAPDAAVTGAPAALAGNGLPVNDLNGAARQMAATAERQGGQFSSEPASPAQGWVYVLDLPLHALSTEPAADTPPRRARSWAAQPSLQGLRVVLVEDGADARASLQALLGLEGAQVQAFEGGREALQWFSTRPHDHWPDILVCDIALDDINGHQLVQQLRRLEAARAVPVSARMPAVALTGLGSAGDRQQALAAGFQRHLAKPVPPRDLVAALVALAASRLPPALNARH